MKKVGNWNLVADIGGTNARFAALAAGAMEGGHRFFHSVQEYPQFYGLISRLLAEIATATNFSGPPQKVCLAVACPAHDDHIAFTNSHWEFSQLQLTKLIDCASLAVINDFEAVAHSITELQAGDCLQIGGDQPRPDKPIGILGPGTGLGVAGLVRQREDYSVLDTEGGHVDFAPVNEEQIAILRYLQKSYGRVSVERLISGQGLLSIYQALCHLEKMSPVLAAPAEVTAAALDGDDPLALRTLHLFCEVLGGFAGDLALTLGARGGIYIAGGIIPRFPQFFAESGFRRCFEAKGRFNGYVKQIPVYLVVRENLGLLGAAKKLKLL